MKKLLHSAILIALIIILTNKISYAQIPNMVKNIYPSVGSSLSTSSFNAMELNGVLLFTPNDSVHGAELWSSDATLAGTNMVKDIKMGTGSSAIGAFFKWNNIVYFSANDGGAGSEIWQTDGTNAGTNMLIDIWSGVGSSSPNQFTDAGNGTFYFVANDGTHGEELWKSDGTVLGTVMVKDIYVGTNGSTITIETMMNGILYFMANDGIHGKELWGSDGTSGGTDLIKDINVGGTNSLFYHFCQCNNNLYFEVNDAVHGIELWKSDGTTAGTNLFIDITPGGNTSSTTFISNNFADTTEFYFMTFINSGPFNDSVFLWKSDGTIGGTSIYKYIWNNYAVSSIYGNFLQKNNGKIIFSLTDNSGYEILGMTNGTNSGTFNLTDSLGNTFNTPPTNIPYFNNMWIFPNYSSTGGNGNEPYQTDGTPGNVTKIADINPNGSCNYDVVPRNTIIWANELYFSAYDGGTTGTELWKTDGTTIGTQLVEDIYVGSNSGVGGGFFIAGANLFFPANDGVNGVELWSFPPNTVSVNNFKTNDGINISPNPFTSQTTISFSSEQKNATIKITDVLGKQIKTETFSGKQFIIEKGDLSKGIYFVQITDENKNIINKKIVVQ